MTARPTPSAGQPSGTFVILSQGLTDHVTLALDVHARWLRLQGIGQPDGWAEMVSALSNRSPAGQHGSSLDALAQAVQSSRVTPRLLTFDDAATVLRVGVSTVKRLVKAGELHPVKVLGASRLPATDLDAYVERITTEPTPSTLSEGA